MEGAYVFRKQHRGDGFTGKRTDVPAVYVYNERFSSCDASFLATAHLRHALNMLIWSKRAGEQSASDSGAFPVIMRALVSRA